MRTQRLKLRRTEASQMKKAPELWEEFRRWVFKHFGWKGLVVLALIGLAFLASWNWEKVRTLPGLSQIIAWIEQAPIPKADPSRYSLMVAQFENDPNREHRRLVLSSLSELGWIQVLAVERMISPHGPDADAAERAGHARAREILKESGAEAMIWGEVLRHGEKSLLKLFWTVSRDARVGKESGRYHIISDELRLPEIFWEDLANVLLLLVSQQSSDFESQRGQFIADRLKPFIERTRKLIEGAATSRDWDPASTAKVRVLLAGALWHYGEQAGDGDSLKEAIRAYREALKTITIESNAQDWASTQNNLGNALGMLGERESGTARLEEAVAAYREALKEFTQERVPLEWAATQNNLGAALSRLGERESGTGRLEEAVAAYREALKEYTRERVPLDWAMTQNNLGYALGMLGERESGTGRLKEAVAAYREALKEYTRERVPLQWAATQNNLGYALRMLGERESGTARLEEALSAIESARSVYREAGILRYEAHFEATLQSLRQLIAQRRSR